MKLLLLAILVWMGATATAQVRPPRDHGAEKFERLRSLNLSAEQKRKLMALIRKEKLQQWLNKQELEAILTPEQKQQLLKWKTPPPTHKKDSTQKQ
jgi:hypothetical protein